MAVTLQETPSADRIHIGFFGKRNSGKSSLLNALTGQEVSIVSQEAGTTTDPVNKPMELHGLGACVLIDTAGFDDVGQLGQSRVEKTRRAAERTDLAVLLCSDGGLDEEAFWYDYFRGRHTPVVLVVSKADADGGKELAAQVERRFAKEPVLVSAKSGEGIEEFREQLLRALPSDDAHTGIVGNLAGEGDLVLLVMPQDIQAPKGRLILPQVQTLRELLDRKCLIMSATAEKLEDALAALQRPPRLIITDSQVFQTVYEKKPAASVLTSFSVLFAAYKGDIEYYRRSAETIGRLTERSRVLIAECCTHAPLAEDIGREKLPRMLRRRCGEGLRVDLVSGTDFREDVGAYDLIIQCGACMFNRKYVLARIGRAKEQNVPMTNYGVAIAYLSGILDQVAYVK